MNAKATTKVLLLLMLLFPVCAGAAGLGELRLSLIKGDVQIKTADHSEWSLAAVNFPLKDGDQLWVPEEGRAEVESRRGTIVRLDERTALDILTVDNNALQFYLSRGLVYVNAKGERGTTLQVETPLSSIRVYERAKFSAEVADDDSTDISVYLGAILAENKKGETMVKAGKMLSLERDSADLSPLGSVVDAWERWNGDQDRAIEEQQESVRYLPEELAVYSSDFDRNGEWVEAPAYGYVWRPTVQVATDWSPYRHGRWVWIGDDYVWIAHEPWGWAPYHYGRWSFMPRHGWCWVPPARHEAYWGPGYVGWVHTSTYVSWVPLAPKEVYYGHGYHGPHSVDIMHVDINKVVIKNTYKNVYVKNSVTTIHNDTFIRGKQVDFTVKENPFLQEKISVGRPQIAPEMATRAAVISEIPKSQEPPDLVKENRGEELKRQRRLVKERDKSVFSPETTPQAMAVDEKMEPRPSIHDRTKLKEEESQRILSPTREETQPTPAAGREILPSEPPAPPPADRREEKQIQPAEEERRPNRDEGDSHTTRQRPQAPTPRAEAQPIPAEREIMAPEPPAPPPADRREEKQRPQPAEEEGRSNRDEGDIHTTRQRPQAPSSRVEAQPTPAEREVLAPEPPAPPPADRREEKQRPQPAAEESRPNREEGDGRTTRQRPQAPSSRVEAQPTPVEREVLAPEPPAPPPADRREEKQRLQPAAEESRPNREEGDSHATRQRPQAPSPRAEAQPTPVEREVLAPEPPAPPPADRREEKQRPQPAAEERQPNREEGDRHKIQQAPQAPPPPPAEAAAPAPTQEVAKPTPGHKKKVKGDPTSEAEEVPAEEAPK